MNILFLLKIYLLERERVGRQAEGERERISSRLPTEQGAQCVSYDPEIMT